MNNDWDKLIKKTIVESAKTMINRYGFYSAFSYDPSTNIIYPRVNVLINGVYFQAFFNIPRGNSFGGLDLYMLMGRDVAGIWNGDTKTLSILGFY